MVAPDRRGAKPDRRRALWCLCLLLLLLLPVPGGGLSVQHKFVSATATNNFALDGSGSKIYLAAVNRLYQLSGPSLTLEVEEQVGPREDSPLCHAPQLPQASCEHAKKPTDNYNKLLQPDPEQGILVVCGSVYQGFCQLRSMDNISVVAVAFPPGAAGGHEQVPVFPSMLNVAANHANASTVGLVLRQPGRAPRLLVASTYTGWGSAFFPRNQSLEDHRFENTPEIAIRALDARGDLARLFTFDINPSDDNVFKIKQGAKERHRLTFVRAFLHRGSQAPPPAPPAPPPRPQGDPGSQGAPFPDRASPSGRPAGSYAYLALNSEANAREKESHLQSLLARICLGDATTLNGSDGGAETKKLTESYIQMGLQCGTGGGVAGGALFHRLVSVFPARAALQVAAGSPGPPPPEELLFGVFEKAVGGPGPGGRLAPVPSALCVFRFAEIEEAIRKARHSCFVAPDAGLVAVLDSVVQGTGPACEKRRIQNMHYEAYTHYFVYNLQLNQAKSMLRSYFHPRTVPE
uniref:Plexin-D1 n=1 Tax=Sphaerodactylus townsendi TaxID=933632 RepID=A0ACB8EH25_9SAUR